MVEPVPNRSGRPRSTTVDDRIREAVLGLLAERGPRAATVEAVAARSGVAKTTIYRRYDDHAAMLVGVVRGAVGVPEVPDAGDVRTRVHHALEQLWRQLSDVLGPGGMAALVSAAEPEDARLLREAIDPYELAMVDLVRRDIAAGLLRADLDADATVSLLLGGYLGELLRRGSVGPDWLERCLDLVWPALSEPRGRRRRP